MGPHKFLKRLSSYTVLPAVQWYLRKERKYRWAGLTVRVSPGVFHPGLFSSTSFLLSYLRKQNLAGCTLLELGCGTALISIFASKAGAAITASDLSQGALQNARANAVLNDAQINIIHSDLFDAIPREAFDWIIINPPYYAKEPKDEASLAWYCGQNFEYFWKLFKDIGNYMHGTTQAVMVLTKGCDIASITGIAEASNFKLRLVEQKNVLFDEKDYLFQIVKVNSLA